MASLVNKLDSWFDFLRFSRDFSEILRSDITFSFYLSQQTDDAFVQGFS